MYGLPDSITIICVGTFFAGIAGALTNNFAVPAMDGISKTLDFSQEDSGELKNIISSINTGAFGFGSILGPIFASVFSNFFKPDEGYRGSYNIAFILVLSVAVLKNYSVYKYKPKNRNHSSSRRIYESDAEGQEMIEAPQINLG